MKGNTFFSSNQSTAKSAQFSVINISRAGILTSIGLVLNLMFLVYIPIAGLNAIKVTFSTAFTMLTGIICGPVMGFFSGAIVDILTSTIKPVGPYFPGFTLAAGLSGLIPAIMYKYLKKDRINYNFLNVVLISVLSAAFVGAFMIKGLLSFKNGLVYYNNSPLSMWIIVGFIALVISYISIPIFITSRFNFKVRVDKILFVVSISQFLISILLNTYFISLTFGTSFSILLPGRIISNFFMIPIYTLIMATILGITERVFKISIK